MEWHHWWCCHNSHETRRHCIQEECHHPCPRRRPKCRQIFPQFCQWRRRKSSGRIVWQGSGDRSKLTNPVARSRAVFRRRRSNCLDIVQDCLHARGHCRVWNLVWNYSLKCRITWRGPCLRVENCSEIKVKSKPKVLNLLVDIFATSLTVWN